LSGILFAGLAGAFTGFLLGFRVLFPRPLVLVVLLWAEIVVDDKSSLSFRRLYRVSFCRMEESLSLFSVLRLFFLLLLLSLIQVRLELDSIAF